MESMEKYTQICSQKSLLESEVEITVESEFALPEYYAPIKRTLNCKFEPAISSKNYTGNTVNIDGVMSVKLIYCDDLNELNTFESAIVFSKNIETEFEISKCLLSVRIVDSKLTYNVKGERRFEVKGNVIVKFTIFEIEKTKCLSDVQDRNFELKSCIAPLKQSIKVADKNIIIDDEIELSESHAKIARILNYEGVILADECKLMKDKIMLKGTLILNVTYLSEKDCKPCRVQHKIPYSQVCEVEGLTEEFSCNTCEKLLYLEVKCRNGINDESRSMSVNAKLCVTINAFLENELAVVTDLYSIHNNVNLKTGVIDSKFLKECNKDIFNVKKSLEFSEGSIGSVVDMWSSVKITGVSMKDNHILISGIVYIKMIVCDADENYQYIERMIDFEYKYNTSYSSVKCEADADIKLTNLNYLIVNDNTVEVMCNLNINLNVFESKTINAITEMHVENISDCDSNCAIYLCYLDKETDLWELAKSHRSSISNIRRINDINEEQDTVKGALLIPVNH